MLDRSGAFDEDRRLIGVEDWELWARLAFFGPVVCRRKPLVHGRSITDPCLAWETTLPVLAQLATAVKTRRTQK